MPVIDTHAHVTPERYKQAIRTRGEWYGLDEHPGELGFGKFDISLPDRLAEMDALGVDMQLVTPTVGFYQYSNELSKTKLINRECNNEIAEMVEQHPTRFAGMGIVPMQDPPSAIAEMERVMLELGMKGVVISDHVAGRTYDDPDFLPFFAAAEELGAIVFFHQSQDTIVAKRNSRYKLPNAVGNLTERALVYATLVFGGVLDRFPDLKPLLAHGGGYTAYGVARMDKVAGALEAGEGMTPVFKGNDGFSQQLAPSEYLSRFYYDCCTYSGSVLRFLIDAVGIERVVLGTDYPAPMVLADCVNWVRGLPELGLDEKEAILSENPARLLGFSG
ncbi:MAG: amidohydrolase [Acidimicrobiia bacterium]|nr:amidohydrolase [Acidimicrobiia bacterium]